MKKTITITALGLLMLVGVMAMYAGESMTFETNLTAPVYTVAGNSSNIEGISVIFENGNITIDSDPMMASDNFTMVFFDEVTREITNTVYSGGSGGSGSGRITKYIDRNVTTFVPEYINNTETIEVEKELEKIVYKESNNKYKMIAGALLVGFLISYAIFKRKDDYEYEEETEEMQ